MTALQLQLETVERVLKPKDICLPSLVINYAGPLTDITFFPILSPRRSRFHHFHNYTFECTALSDIMRVCKQLTLINVRAAEAIIGSAIQILYLDMEAALPEPERRVFMRPGHVVKWDIIIPLLRFYSTETPAEQWRVFLAAANANCPVVSQAAFRKVTQLYAPWEQTLVYPDEWVGIRIFLQMLKEPCPADPQRWETMDLRQLDISTLTNVTVAALDACYTE
ncbi:uncharacterized protein LOC129594510 [Paramacrobiotus metropolitanus]|uniref:uncharacterized protein LOC129594510 n=1 Tax=Paramacrobiotus metropolitanus TaxID=2943436 RepID=UPI0024463E26|nr:uncharacterized protein LOC129594510 [Paramacrobiotus metropolitanus]